MTFPGTLRALALGLLIASALGAPTAGAGKPKQNPPPEAAQPVQPPPPAPPQPVYVPPPPGPPQPVYVPPPPVYGPPPPGAYGTYAAPAPAPAGVKGNNQKRKECRKQYGCSQDLNIACAPCAGL
jgi:hypothetical protein